MNRTNPPKLDSKVFNLASNLFGYGDANEKQAICNDIAKTVAKDLQNMINVEKQYDNE